MNSKDLYLPTPDASIPQVDPRVAQRSVGFSSLKQEWRPSETLVEESWSELPLEKVLTTSTHLSLDDVLESTEHIDEKFVAAGFDEAAAKAVFVEPGLPVGASADDQRAFIIKKFNEGVDNPVLSTSVVRGEWVEIDELILAQRNNVAECAGGPRKARYCLPLGRAFQPAVDINIAAKVKFSAPYFNCSNKHVLNVPRGKYVRVLFGLTPKLLLPGTHVIVDTNFRLVGHNIETSMSDIMDDYINVQNVHIIRVNVGKFVKVWVQQKALLLSARPMKPYVFIAQFALGGRTFADSVVDMTSPYIAHGPIHLLRIPQGKLIKVWFGNEAKLLVARSEPYRFNDPLFRLDAADVSRAAEAGLQQFNRSLVDLANTNYISHGNTHILRVAPGYFAAIYLMNQPVILADRPDPYVFHTPWFRLGSDDASKKGDEKTCMFSQNEYYINHGTLHIVRVPVAKIAKVWLGQNARLLYSRSTPYVFKNAQFRMVTTPISKIEPVFMEDMNARFFRHGNLTYVMPRTGEVAQAYNCGKLEIIAPPKDGKPVELDASTFEVNPEFVSTTMQTLIFPSKEQQQKKREEKAPADEIPFTCVMTSDSLKVGVKLLVAYQIADPYLALSQIRREDISRHIESVSDADMTRAVQRCTSMQFLSSYRNTPKVVSSAAEHDPQEQERRTIQDDIRDHLAEDLQKYGINLIRMNFEEAKVLNAQILEQLQQQALSTASTNAQASIIQQQYDIARKRAEQEAEVARIKQQQANQNVINQARAAGEAVKVQAEAELVAAERRAKTKIMEAEAEAKAILLKAEAEQKAAQLSAEVMQKYPAALKLEVARLQAKAWDKVTLIAPADEISKLLSASSKGIN